MKLSRFQPLVWPAALLATGGVTALLAEATTMSVETVTRYGMVKLVSDLLLLIGIIWLGPGLLRVVRSARR
jgi:hypothetical protein